VGLLRLREAESLPKPFDRLRTSIFNTIPVPFFVNYKTRIYG
jgi:hypothetical protein